MKKPKISSILKFLSFTSLFCLFTVFILVFGIYFYLKPELPSMESLKDLRFQIPLKVYSRDEQLIAEFGEQRRTPIAYDDIPDTFIKAVMAAEDQNFFEHSGVDVKALFRAVKLMIQNKGSIHGGGGSTITMQLTRALFLNKDRKFKRKFKEIILTIQLEQELSKQEILELYFNEIYLGKRAYGIQAAANIYYEKNVDELNLAQLAMIAGLPKAPAANNPVNNPERALVRRNWILGRMLKLDFISEEQYSEALAESISAQDYGQSNTVNAPFLAEMIRQDLYEEYGSDIYTEGYKAYATINSDYQGYASNAVHEGIHQYNERHGYNGPLLQIENIELFDLQKKYLEDRPKQEPSPANLKDEVEVHKPYDLVRLRKLLAETEIDTQELIAAIPTFGILKPALILVVDDEKKVALTVLDKDQMVAVEAKDILWASKFIDRNTSGKKPKTISEVLQSGDIVYLREHKKDQWRLAQKPEVQSAFVALDPNDGSILSLVGGYNYYDNKFNRVIQDGRQAGSSLKPFLYTAALENGYTAASIINDAPVVFNDSTLEETWRPENSGGKFYGPTRFRKALYRSRNLVSIRILRKLGVPKTIESMQRFGFNKQQLPANLSLSLGSASLSPLQVASGFSTFANGGYRIKPYYLERLESSDGTVLFQAEPDAACIPCLKQKSAELKFIKELDSSINSNSQSKDENTDNNKQDLNQTISLDLAETVVVVEPKQAEQIIEPRVNYIIDSILGDVVKRGTARKALALNRQDIRGKTGTTNDQVDAWFTGYNNDIVASVWVGFDSPTTLGRGEFGAVAALPIWLSFMEKALEGKEERMLNRPDKLVTVKINSETGEAAKPGEEDAIFEIFREENAPELSLEQQNTSNKEINEEVDINELF